MKVGEAEKESFSFVKESRLSINYDINYDGIKRDIKNSFNLLKIYICYIQICYLCLVIFLKNYYEEMNVYLEQKLKEALNYGKK
jgi:hypothetical protein